MLEGLLLALGRKEMSFHAILTFSPGSKRQTCVNPDGGCFCQCSPVQYRQELWGVSAAYCMTFSEEADLKNMIAEEEQK